MKDWHKIVWKQNGELTINEICKEIPNINKGTIKAYCVAKKVPYKKLEKVNEEWKYFVRTQGHKYTMNELITKFPKANPITIKSFCSLNQIPYIKTHPNKSHRKQKLNTNPEYFNVTEHETWLI